MTTTTIDERPARSRLRRGDLNLMAVTAGLSVAGNYFAQPLLGLFQAELGVSATTAGMLVTAAQVGYALGLALLLPLGDRLPRRGLAATLLVLTALSLAVAGAAPNGGVLLFATLTAAGTSIGAQVLVPFAAALTSPEGRGRAVGVVMSGVLLGGLLGRAAAGLLADFAGWRSVYWVTAVLLVLVATAVTRILPDGTSMADETPERLSYGRLLWSVVRLLGELPVLRLRTLVAALAMATYTVQLTTVTLLLSGRPYGWSPTAIGAFGLLGAVGALSMSVTGRIVDRGHVQRVTVAGLLLSGTSWGVMALAQHGAAIWLALGTIMLNLGQQAVLLSSQTVVYSLRPEARNRLNSAFMTMFFCGGGAGATLASLAWSYGEWAAVCVLGAALAAVALAVFAWHSLRTAPSSRQPV